MKRFFIALAAMAAMVGCSKENTPSEVITVDNFTVDAKIVVDDTRVTVEGEKFTDVKWELDDKVTLASEAGAKATLSATEAGDVVRFRGEGTYAADVDTYYAIYPNIDIVDGVASMSLATQSGDDAAVLAAASYSVPKGVIDMEFTPQNALLHVSVTNGVALAKAELKAFDGAMLPETYIFSFKQGKPSASGEVTSYVIENPSNSFFFALPADLELANGYIIYLTDSNNNVCSKAYNGKTFKNATTTRVDIEFAAPKVNLGEPMTSYSYYLQKNSTQANNCANNVIYFPNATTISNLQNAMIADYGYVVEGVTYGKEKMNYNPTDKSFKMTQTHTVSSWGAKSVEAYVVTTDGRRYSASTTVHITGLPYVAAPPTEAAGWKEASWNVDWTGSYVQLGGVSGSGAANITSPAFNDLPATINTQFIADTRMGSLNAGLFWVQTDFNLYSGGTKVISQGSGKQNGKDFYLTGNGTMSKGTVIKLESTYTAAGPWVQVRSLQILYR